MLKHYLVTALRNLLKHRVYTLINVFGLAIAIACATLIGLYVKHETSYDAFHKDSDRLYRVACNFKFPDKLDELSVASPPVAFTLKRDYPEVEAFTQISSYNVPRLLVKYGNNSFYEENVLYADSLFLSFFKFPLLKGDVVSALKEPNSVVITETMAQKFFGTENPIGKVLQYDNNDGTFADYKVTGVAQNPPTNSHIRFESLVSLNGVYKQFPQYRDQWISASLWTYLRLKQGVDWKSFENKIVNLPDKYLNQNQNLGLSAKVSLHLEPVTSIHLHSKRLWDISPPGNQQYVYIFLIVGIFLLLIACINYTNLATARAGVRMREIGMRQVAGAQRKQLIAQLMGESAVIAVLAMFVSLALAELAVPLLRKLTGIDFHEGALFQPGILLPLVAITIFVTLLSGFYPAIYLTSFNPVTVLKSNGRGAGNRGITLRKGLVVFQFAVSAALIVATAIVYLQLHYLKSKDVGFQREGLMAVRLQDTVVAAKYDALRAEISEIPDVKGAAYAATIPGDPPDRKITRVEGKTPSELQEIPTEPIYIDQHYFDVMQSKLAQGRTFSADMTTDLKEAFLINEAAAQKFGWKEALGKRVVWGFQPPNMRDGKVVGVMHNIYTGSLREPPEPILFLLTKKAFAYGYVLVRFRDNGENGKQLVENIFRKYDPAHPVEAVFLDEHMARLYGDETRMSELFTWFTGLTIFIACLGLVGLVSFSMEQRRKEIGIRKVLGAGVRSLLRLAAGEYLALVAIALVMAFPLAFWLMNKWLEDFAFHIGIGAMPFVLSGLAVIVIALLTVIAVSMRAALTNPAKTLKYE